MKKLTGVLVCLLLFTFISSARIIEVADAGITDKLRAVIAAKNAGSEQGGGSWVFPSGISASSDDSSTESGFLHASYLYGGLIQATSSSTITAIGVKLTDADISNIKIGLYNSSGDTLLDSCGPILTTQTGTPKWYTCDVNYSATNSTSYLVLYSAESDDNLMRYDSSENGYYGTCAYASAMCSDISGTLGLEAKGYMAAYCIGGDCATGP